MVFVDQGLGTGVDEKKDAGDPSLKWNKGTLFADMHAYISEKAMAPDSSILPGKPHGRRSLLDCSPWGR